MNLVAIPAFSDNYIWLLHDGREAVVVDPGDAAPVEAALAAAGLRLSTILLTHHHPDHVGGVEVLRRQHSAQVFGAAREDLPRPFSPVGDGSLITLLGQPVEVLDVPGHTAGHVAFVVNPSAPSPILFCGDTLFSAGCGRLFEGTPKQMHASLQRLAALPAATRVCCAHEYTLANLRFAMAVEPGNHDTAAHHARCLRQRELGEPTLPSSLAMELRVNPFLRCAEAAVQRAAVTRGATPGDVVSVFAALRQWKNVFS